MLKLTLLTIFKVSIQHDSNIDNDSAADNGNNGGAYNHDNTKTHINEIFIILWIMMTIMTIQNY